MRPSDLIYNLHSRPLVATIVGASTSGINGVNETRLLSLYVSDSLRFVEKRRLFDFNEEASPAMVEVTNSNAAVRLITKIFIKEWMGVTSKEWMEVTSKHSTFVFLFG